MKPFNSFGKSLLLLRWLSLGVLAGFSANAFADLVDSPRMRRALTELERAQNPDLMRVQAVCAEELRTDGCLQNFRAFCDDFIENEESNSNRHRFGKNDFQYHHAEVLAIRALYSAYNTPGFSSKLHKVLERWDFADTITEVLKAVDPKFDEYSIEGVHSSTSSLNRRDVRRKISQVKQDLDQAIESVASENFAQRILSPIADYPLSERNWQRDVREQRRSTFTAIWRNSPEWIRMKSIAESVRTSALEWISNKAGLTPSQKREWRQIVRNIIFIPPGAGTKEKQENENCAFGNLNAFAHLEANKIEFCAGILTSDLPEIIIAHEIGHFLGLKFALLQHWNRLAKIRALRELQNDTCEKGHSMDCSKWRKYRTEFTDLNRELSEYKPKHSEYFNCLQRGKELKPLDELTVKSIASDGSEQEIAILAKENLFIWLTEPSITISQTGGNFSQSELFQNACFVSNFNEIGEIGGLESAAIYFLYEYVCENAPLTPAARFAAAIETARDMRALDLEAWLLAEGRHSGALNLNLSNHADYVEERSADNLGAKIFAHYMSKTEAQDENRYEYLALVCQYSSNLERTFPGKIAIQENYHFTPHTRGVERWKELLTPEVRSFLGCRLDFQPKTECEL